MLKKKQGQVYTPPFMVKIILELSEYKGKSIIKKHVIDNSCGDGAFLTEVVKLYCETAQLEGLSNAEIQSDLSTFIHGIEIDSIEQAKCIKSLDNVAKSFNIYNVKWDILCTDALTVSTYDNKMDFVVGNPPYIRIHNLNDISNIKKLLFSQNGMIDLYISFFEIGIKMLKNNGILGYITPSSFFNSLAGKYMRKEFIQKNLIKKIVDLKHFQAFEATTYTAISIIQKKKLNKDIEFYLFDETKLKPIFIDLLNPNDYYIAGNFYFSKRSELNFIKKIHSNISISDICVKNGYATLCDSVFIKKFPFKSKYIIPTVKSSTAQFYEIFFPYDKNSKLIEETELKKDGNIYNYLITNKEKLLQRANEKDAKKYWYAYGRSQAISDTYKNKLAINTILRTENDFKFSEAPAGVGVFGGLYIISDTISYEDIKTALKSKEFMTYVSLLGKYKSGGYYAFSSKDVKRYLDYKFSYTKGLLLCQ